MLPEVNQKVNHSASPRYYKSATPPETFDPTVFLHQPLKWCFCASRCGIYVCVKCKFAAFNLPKIQIWNNNSHIMQRVSAATCCRCRRPPLPTPSTHWGSRWSSGTVFCSSLRLLQSIRRRAVWRKGGEKIRDLRKNPLAVGEILPQK